MGLGSQVHDHVGLEGREDLLQRGEIADVHLVEFVAVGVGDFDQGVHVTGVRQLVDVGNLHWVFVDKKT